MIEEEENMKWRLWEIKRSAYKQLSNKKIMSNLYKLNLNDWTKGLIVAVLVVVLGMLQQALTAHGLNILAYNWGEILNVAIMAGLGYLGKNLLTNEEGKVLGIATK